jgi:hypothetical protein
MTSTEVALARATLEILTIEEIRSACAKSRPVTFADPMLARAELPLSKTFYPFGFPLEIHTNAEEILSAATESWSGFAKLFDIAPIVFHVGVTEGGSSECPPVPSSRAREHLCSNIADAENFAISDHLKSFSFMWLTQKTLEHRDYVRYFFLESCSMYHLATHFGMGIHAACVDLDGTGILLCGDSGAGKTTLSYALARAGWTFITDDASFLVGDREDLLVVGNSRQLRFRPSAGALFPELQGLPILHRAETGKPSLEVSTAPLARVATSQYSRVKYVVFLNRANVCEQELVAFPADAAKLTMMQRVYGTPDAMAAKNAMVDQLLRQGALELRYTDLDFAIERLGRLVREGH